MLSYLVLGLFSVSLVLCVISGRSILYALGVGLVLFFGYGLGRGKSVSDLLHYCFRGIKASRNIFLNFLFIGLLTASWRAAGTIPFIVSVCASLVRPSLFLLLVFVFNSAVSVLTGSSFGTSATMGVMSMSMAGAMEISPVMAGGAALAGAYFGDRLSPVATSAILVSELTRTDLYGNLKRMAKNCAVPAALTCLLYLLIGFGAHHGSEVPNLMVLFSGEFKLTWVCALPAAVMLVLASRHLNFKFTMGGSILAGIVVALLLQKTAPLAMLKMLWSGYKAADPALSAMINGGGIRSMVKSGCILALTTACSGIFRETDLLDGLHREVRRLAGRVTPFGATLMSALGTSAIACNQTLGIILTHQLCTDLYDSKEDAALALEDTAVVACAYWPWSIAAATPLSSMGAPDASILAALYLFLLPLWHLTHSIRQRRKTHE
ncbi:MAG: sodium:proton antiporter [Clostridia bacterium]|nr:sodium:proton antiporter [Clostridia bacterium]